MINSRDLYVPERDPTPLMPKREPKPVEPAPKWAIIQRKDMGLEEGISGRQIVEIRAIDEETGEVIASKQIRQFTITPSSYLTIESEVAESVREKGYNVKYDLKYEK